MPEILKTYFWIGLGSALGGMGRFWLSTFMAQRLGEKFPWGTLLVNISGCFLIGLFATTIGSEGKMFSPTARQFFMVGICGGYTTFSAFSIQTLDLARGGQWGGAVAYVLLSVVLCLLGVWLGHWIGHSVNR